MAEESLTYTNDGSIFQVDRAVFVRSGAASPAGQVTLVVHNRSGDWVDVNIDRNIGVAKTGHIANGQDGGFSEVSQLYEGSNGNKLTRWRPGFAGVPGNGGGELTFWVPVNVERVQLEITVKG